MSTEKVIAILAALLADQENVKVSYEIHKDNYAEEKTAKWRNAAWTSNKRGGEIDA